jgi:hypothetical protein
MCDAGICRHTTAAPDGTACVVPKSCRGPGQCIAGACETGPVVANGTPCPDNDPCNGLEMCLGGECAPATGPATLDVSKITVVHGKPGGGSVTLTGSITPVLPVAPSSSQPVGLELHNGGTMIYDGSLDGPAADVLWKTKKKGKRFLYKDKTGSNDGITNADLQSKKAGSLQVKITSKRLSMPQLTSRDTTPRVIVGDECFEANLSQCKLSASKLSCAH